MTFPAKFPSLNDTTFTDRARTVLIRVIRVAFPHAAVPDAPYERTADVILTEAEASTWFRVAMTQGLNSLDDLADGDFCALDDARGYEVLQGIESTDFFGFIRRTTVLNLYDDPEVWQALGYQGSSVEHGGYLHRGFDDLDWLPDPRVEEYDGPETLVEFAEGPGDPVVDLPTDTEVTDSTQPAAPTGVPDQTDGDLRATLSADQGPHQGAAQAGRSSEKASV